MQTSVKWARKFGGKRTNFQLKMHPRNVPSFTAALKTLEVVYKWFKNWTVECTEDNYSEFWVIHTLFPLILQPNFKHPERDRR